MDVSAKTTVQVRLGDEVYLVSLTGGIDSPSLEIEVAGSSGDVTKLGIGVVSRNGALWILEVEGRLEEVEVSRDGEDILVDWRNHSFRLQAHSAQDGDFEPFVPEASGQDKVRAQMAGKVVAVLKQPGDSVQAGDGLLIIEAMKMQNELTASRSGTVSACHIREGQIVNAGDLLMEIADRRG
jgi:biotin carboxyl carrier protein